MTRWYPLLLFLGSLVIRLTTAFITDFDGLYGQDPFAYYQYAIELRQALSSLNLPPPFFWPIGYPLLVIPLFTLLGVQPFAAQLTSMIATALIAPLVYLLVLEYKPDAHKSGLLISLITILSSQLFISSLSIMADTAALMWATLSALMLARYSRRLQLRWLALAAATIGLAILTRTIYILLVIPWSVTVLLAWHTAKLSWRQILIAAGVAAIIGISVSGFQFIGDIGREQLSYVGSVRVYEWHPANAFKRDVVNADGAFHYERPIGLFYALPAIHPAYVFPLLALFYLPGLWWLRRQPPALIALLLGWPLAIYLLLAGVTWQNWRFPLSFFPPLLLLAGLGIDQVWHWVHRRGQTAVLTICLLALIGSLGWTIRDVSRFTAWKAAHLKTAAWVTDQLPADATLLTFGLALTLDHYTPLDIANLFTLKETEMATFVREHASLYLLIDPEVIQTQWQNKSPDINVRWLDEHTHLLRIGRSQQFILFQVTPKTAASSGTTPLLVAPEK